MEDFLRRSLNVRSVKAGPGRNVYQIDEGKMVFVKRSSAANAREMLTGEMASLLAVAKTGCVRVPHPEAVLDDPRGASHGAMLVMEYFRLRGLGAVQAGQLGDKVARMHLHNLELGRQGHEDYVGRFGFGVPTCCGTIMQKNAWDDRWTSFYASKLQEQMDLVKKDYGDREALDLWRELKPKIPEFFENLDVKPSLLHGDLWSGNTGQVDDEAVLFDAGSFYGHHESDLGIAGMFGMSARFFASYHKVIPKAPGFEDRHQLYQLFHYLNHWNHFGGGYRHQSLRIMRKLIAK